MQLHKPLLEELKKYRKERDSIGWLLESGDGAGLEKLFAEARAAREKWIHSS